MAYTTSTSKQNYTEDDEAVKDEAGSYRPNKAERIVRRKVYERYREMRDDSQRKEAETDWDNADKEYRMYIPEIDTDDWRSHLELPDAFSAIQTSMQETIERKSRPHLVGVEESDAAREKFSNAIINWNMNRTGFDLQYFYAKLCAAIRGTAWLKEYYRVEERTVEDPTDVDDEGLLVYKEKRITDFDDAYTEWVDNQFVFIDPGAKSIEEASDCFERKIMAIEDFRHKYTDKPGYKNIKYVKPGGDVGRTSFFQVPQDMMADEVELLCYYNRDKDKYCEVANNVVIYESPLPTKHKELPFAVVYHYRVPGRFWGLGIPKVVKYLSEERKAIRRLNLDRQKLQLNKMFLVNNAFDLDEEELESRPHGLIGVETGGQPLANVIQPIEYGDVSSSYFRTEEILLEDIRRAHGIDDRIVVSNQSTTATQAAIVKESSLKRVNMVSILAEMDTIIRLGRLKWSNIQFFYKAPRYEKIYLENEEHERRVDRKITVDGMQFKITKDPGTQKNTISYSEVEGKTVFKLDKNMARYMEGDYDVTIDATIFTPMSKAIKQAKTTEMITTILSNSNLTAELDPKKTLKRYFEVNEESPEVWMLDSRTKEKLVELADLENYAMQDGTPLQGTEGATEEHTLVHINFTETAEFQALPETTQEIFANHILEEHDNNPLTGSSAEMLQGFGLEPEIPGEGPAGAQSMVQGAPAPSIQPQIPGQIQPVDMGPANMNPRPE
jgi:hypothetical protein